MILIQWMAVMTMFPYMALVMAVILALLYWRFKRKTSLLAASLWLSYFVFELLNFLRITCSGECNIRFDLLIIYPLLLLSVVIAVIALFMAPKSRVG